MLSPQEPRVDCLNQMPSHSTNSEQDLLNEITLSVIRKNCKDKLLIGNLNINSLPNKFDQLKVIIQGKLDILVITETKIDNSFPTSQFLIEGFCKPYRYDRNRNVGGVLIYVREDIPSKVLPQCAQTDIKAIFLEINLRKSKWLLCGCYHPQVSQITTSSII